MIKIEKIPEGASGTFLRNGNRVPIFAGMLLNIQEANTVEVIGGEVMYTVDEQEIAYFKPKVLDPKSLPTIQLGIRAEPEEEAPVPQTSEVQAEPQTSVSSADSAKPAIVFPESVKNLG